MRKLIFVAMLGLVAVAAGCRDNATTNSGDKNTPMKNGGKGGAAGGAAGAGGGAAGAGGGAAGNAGGGGMAGNARGGAAGNTGSR